jgi:hypothetical protein
MTTTRTLVISQVVMALILGFTAVHSFASSGTPDAGSPALLGSGFPFQGRLEIDGVRC